MTTDLSTLTTKELLALSTEITNELKKRNILRTNNKPTGDYAEWLVAQILKLELTDNSAAHYDALDMHGIRYQIKARMIPQVKGRIQMGAIRGLSEQNFDFLVAIFFDNEYSVIKCLSIPWRIVKTHVYYVERTNSYTVYVQPTKILQQYTEVQDLTELFFQS